MTLPTDEKHQGTILIIATWILAILSVFAIGLGYRMSLNLRTTSYFVDGLKAFHLAKAGLRRSILELEKDETRDYDSINESWANNQKLFKNFSLGEGEYTISYSPEGEKVLYGLADEQRKININKAPLKVLANLPEMNKELAANIIDWRDMDNKGEAETDYYQTLEPPYNAKSADFQSTEELLLVKGITPEIFSKIKDYITVFGNGAVNINTASQETLMILGMSGALAFEIVNSRKGADGEDGTEDDEPFKNLDKVTSRLGLKMLKISEQMQFNKLAGSGLISVKSDSFRASIAARLPDKQIVKRLDCVVDRSTMPVIIKYWHED